METKAKAKVKMENEEQKEEEMKEKDEAEEEEENGNESGSKSKSEMKKALSCNRATNVILRKILFVFDDTWVVSFSLFFVFFITCSL